MQTRRTFLTTAAATTLGTAIHVPAATLPMATIGLIADAQYADLPPAKTRHYRQSIEKLGTAVDHLNKTGPACTLHLGDIIDREWRSFDKILKPLSTARHPIHHLLGNHDFDVLDQHKTAIPGRLGLTRRYYHLDLPGHRLIFLDTTDLSTYAPLPGTPQLAAAQAALQLAKDAKLPQAQPWNSGLSPAQLTWLDATCKAAAILRLKVILFAHHPVFPANPHNLWNSDAVLALIDRHPHIIAWFNGHNHTGNFGTRLGIPYTNLQGMVETPDTTAYATLALHQDRLILTGHGREPSRELLLRKT